MGTARNNIARLNPNGSVDASFNPGAGADYNVYRVILQSDGRILIAGGFETVNGQPHHSFARLNADGTLDSSFNPMIGFVSDAAVQPDGKIVAVGYTINNGFISYIVRLNPDGTADTSFNVGVRLDKSVDSVALQNDGRILIGGDFTQINGITRNGIARLNSDGSLDLTFSPKTTTGGTGLLRNFLLQRDGKIFVSHLDIGESEVNTVIERLNSDGSLDNYFNRCTVAGVAVPAAIQPDSKPIICGPFSMVNGTPHFAIARLLGDAPVIIRQPVGISSKVGTTAVFTVAVSGVMPLNYQWFKNGLPLSDNAHISGATTDTLTIKHVRFIDWGNYTVVVSNAAGYVTSDSALLRVRLPRGGIPGKPGGKINFLERRANGPVHLQISPITGRDCVVEVSTNLQDWEIIGVYPSTGKDSFDFEDTEATQNPVRFYRIVTP